MWSSLSLAGRPSLWSMWHEGKGQLRSNSAEYYSFKGQCMTNSNGIYSFLSLPRSQLWSVGPWAPGHGRPLGSAAGRCSPGAGGSTESPSGRSWTPQHSYGRWHVGRGPGRSESPCWPGKQQLAPRHSSNRTAPPHLPQSPKERMHSYKSMCEFWCLLTCSCLVSISFN